MISFEKKNFKAFKNTEARNHFFKLLFVIFTCLFALFFTLVNFIPSNKFETLKFNLGLDLKGGSNLLLEINFEEYLREKLISSKDQIAQDLRKAKIGYTNLSSDNTGIYFQLRNEDDAKKAISATQKAGAFFKTERLSDGRFKVYLSEEAIAQMRQSVKEQTIEIIRRRIDEKGNKEISLQAGSGNRIILEIPGENSSNTVRSLLNVTARLTFHLLDETAPYLSAKPDVSFQDSKILSDYTLPDSYYTVKNKIEIEGSSLVGAAAIINNGEAAVSFELDSIGAKRFADITRANVGKPFAIVLDGKVLSAPRIREPIIGGAGVISGGFNLEAAKELALLLRSGALPASIKIIEERIVGPSLGAESTKAGKLSAFLAILFVMCFMVFKYKEFGFFACIALFVNLMLIITGLSILGSTLTLPGIAGIVLTVGMSVDANVLIFERIKEVSRSIAGEQTRKKFVKSIEEGFNTSLSTILDSNITTIVTAIALYMVGFGPIKGFAVTLILGILTSMFSSIVLTGIMLKAFANFKKYKIA
jgi:preprotein translocase subunit SecD